MWGHGRLKVTGVGDRGWSLGKCRRGSQGDDNKQQNTCTDFLGESGRDSLRGGVLCVCDCVIWVTGAY